MELVGFRRCVVDWGAYGCDAEPECRDEERFCRMGEGGGEGASEKKEARNDCGGYEDEKDEVEDKDNGADCGKAMELMRSIRKEKCNAASGHGQSEPSPGEVMEALSEGNSLGNWGFLAAAKMVEFLVHCKRS